MTNRDERIQYARELIQNNPDIGRRKINNLVRERYGEGLRSKYVNDLQKTIPRYERFKELREDGFKITDAKKWSAGDIGGQRITQMRAAMQYQAGEHISQKHLITPDQMSRVVADPKLLDLVIKLRRIYPNEYLYGYRDDNGRFKPGILSRPADVLAKQFKSREWRELITGQSNQVKAALKSGLPLKAVLAEFSRRMRRDKTNPFDDIRAKVADEYPKKGKKRPKDRPLRPEYDKVSQAKIRSRKLHRPIKKVAVLNK